MVLFVVQVFCVCVVKRLNSRIIFSHSLFTFVLLLFFVSLREKNCDSFIRANRVIGIMNGQYQFHRIVDRFDFFSTNFAYTTYFEAFHSFLFIRKVDK